MESTNINHFWDVMSVLLSKEMKLRYRGTFFGILWSVANPLAFTAVLYIAVKRVLGANIENYPLFVLSALFAWQWLSNSLSAAPMLFIGNASLIKKLRFPRIALCFAVVLNDMIHFCITLPLLAVFTVIADTHGPGLVWLAGIPVLLFAQLSLTLAAVMIIATLNAFLRDLEQLVRVLLLLVFYVTPIMYPVTMVPQNFKWLLLVNPFSPLIISWRSLLLDNMLSPYMAVAVGYAVISLIIAFPIYRQMEWKLAEVV
jgi:lipopolysaccharide transport system permease protein